MEVRKLNENDYDQLLSLLNEVFTVHSGRQADFLNLLPKMWIRDDLHMGYHIGVFEDERLVSTVGCYPLEVVVGDTSLLFATTGNVATLKEYEGRGYFSLLFDKVMDELQAMGVDAARLGGERQRYGKYGYEPAGTVYDVKFTAKNRIKYYGDVGGDITFTEIFRDDCELLRFCDRVACGSDMYVRRSSDEGYRDVYLALCSKFCRPFVAMQGGKPIGYLSSTIGESCTVYEMRYLSIEHFIPMLCAWQRRIGGNVILRLSPLMREELRLVTPGAEEITALSPSRFKVIRPEKLADPLMRLKSQQLPMAKGERIIGIEGYGNIRLYYDGKNAGCEMTDLPPDITVSRANSTGLLFGNLPIWAYCSEIDPLIESWLPLPFSWNALDVV